MAEAVVEEKEEKEEGYDEKYNVSRGRRDRGREHEPLEGIGVAAIAKVERTAFLVPSRSRGLPMMVVVATAVEWPGDRIGKTARPSLTAVDVCTRLQTMTARTRTPNGIVPSRAATPRCPPGCKVLASVVVLLLLQRSFATQSQFLSRFFPLLLATGAASSSGSR